MPSLVAKAREGDARPVARLISLVEDASPLLREAKVAVSPGIGFGEGGDEFVRFALVENEHRTRQAIRGIRKALKLDGEPA